MRESDYSGIQSIELVLPPCIRCQSNTYTFPQNDHSSELICDRCLQDESRKFLRLRIEAQTFDKKLKEAQQQATIIQSVYAWGTHSLQATFRESLPQEHNEASRQLMRVEEELAREEQEYARLLEELKMVEQQEMAEEEKQIRQEIALQRTHQEIIQQKNTLERLNYFKQHVQNYGKNIEELS